MSRMRLGMEFWIDYAHSLKGHSKCEPIHGHTAKILVEIEGELKGGITYQENMIMDFDDMKVICKEILEKLNHKNLNELFEFPTSENITIWIFEELSKRLPVCKVKFYEGKGKWCTIEK